MISVGPEALRCRYPREVPPLALASGDRRASNEAASSSPEKRAVGRKGNARPRLPPPPADSALAYRINDAAIVSGLSRATLYRLIKESKLRSVRAAGPGSSRPMRCVSSSTGPHDVDPA